MMSENRRDYGYEDERGLKAAVLELMRANPAQSVAAIAGTAVFAVVSVNAMFLQDQSHPSAFFKTRPVGAPSVALTNEEMDIAPASDEGMTRIVFEPAARPERQPAAKAAAPQVAQAEAGTAAKPAASAELRELQQMLAELGFYQGTIDGLDGPRTRKAIEEYKAGVGLKGINLEVAELVQSARNNLIVTAAIPVKRPETPAVPVKKVETVNYKAPTAEVTPVAAAAAPTNDVMRVQAGLRAFGNTGITVDGQFGDQTRAAIREFQALFKLPVTGEVDTALVEKMVDIGLID